MGFSSLVCLPEVKAETQRLKTWSTSSAIRILFNFQLFSRLASGDKFMFLKMMYSSTPKQFALYRAIL